MDRGCTTDRFGKSAKHVHSSSLGVNLVQYWEIIYKFKSGDKVKRGMLQTDLGNLQSMCTLPVLWGNNNKL